MGEDKKDEQGARWCFTFYHEDDLGRLREFPHVALVVAREEGSDNKGVHLQGYIKFSNNKRWSWWKRMFHCHSEASRNSAHWELAKGREWKCRRYIADVAAYLRDNPEAHFKTQGEVLHDYGCEVYVDKDASPLVQVIGMVVRGAKMSQIFKEHPVFYFHNYRKINDLRECVSGWKHDGDDFQPVEIKDEPSKKRYKKDPPPPGAAPDE